MFSHMAGSKVLMSTVVAFEGHLGGRFLPKLTHVVVDRI